MFRTTKTIPLAEYGLTRDPTVGYRISISFKVDTQAEMPLDVALDVDMIAVARATSDTNITTSIEAVIESTSVSKSTFKVGLTIRPADPSLKLGPTDTLAIRSVTVTETVIDLSAHRAFVKHAADSLRDSYFPTLGTNKTARAKRLVDLIHNAIITGAPTSVVRLGDGEGRIVGHPWHFSTYEVGHQAIRYQFGAKAVDQMFHASPFDGLGSSIEKIRGTIIESVRNADAVGVPSLRYLNHDADHSEMRGVRGFACAALVSDVHVPDASRCNTFDTFDFRVALSEGLFTEFLNKLRFLGIISHVDLSKELISEYGIMNVDFTKVPPHATFIKSDCVHFPDAYEKILAGINVPFRGAVYLIGAGYLGKAYCNRVKELGGVAIDVGGVFDLWSGLGRRRLTAISAHRLTAPLYRRVSRPGTDYGQL